MTITIPNYQVKVELFRSSRMVIYRALCDSDQTGRMNRDLDYRTDYYSLGVTLYEMLNGSRPFEAADTIGWIHSHIAQIPVPP